MGLFSRSRSKGHYPNQNYGGGHYKRPHSSGGILGKIFAMLTDFKRQSRYHSDSNSRNYSDYNNENYPNRHKRRSSWS